MRDDPSRDRVVLVADRMNVRRLVEAALGSQHFRVTSATDEEQTLAMARGEPPDLIVAAVDSPGIDGISVAQQLKRDPATASIPLLAIMDQSCRHLHQRAESAGFDAVLLQPITPTTVAQFGRLLVERAALLRERSARLRKSGEDSSFRSMASPSPVPSPAAASSPTTPVGPRCRYCGSNADSRLVKTTASALTYGCGACDGQWRVTHSRVHAGDR